MADELVRVNARRCQRCNDDGLHREDEEFCMECMDSLDEQRAAALSAAEAAVVKAAEEWHAADSEEPCDPERIIGRIEALRSACRELAERRGGQGGGA
jgi:hypothetical protein